MDFPDPKDRLVSHQYAISFDLGEGRGIQVNSTFFADDGLIEMNRKLDILWQALERLRAKVQVEQIKVNLKQAYVTKQQAEDAFTSAWSQGETFKKNGKMVPDSLRIDEATIARDMRRHEEVIADLKSQLAEYERRATT
jgi:hypothetical protein